MNGRSSWGLGLAALLVVVAGVCLYLVGGKEVYSQGLNPQGGLASTTVLSKEQLRHSPERNSIGSELDSLGDGPAKAYILNYFGDDAMAVLAELKDGGVDVDNLRMPIPQEEYEAALPSWLRFREDERDSWSAELREWPKAMDAEWIQQRVGVTVDLNEADMQALEELASLYTHDIDFASDNYLNELELAMSQELQMGQVRSSPFLAWPPPVENQDHTFFSIVRTGQGWVARVLLNQDEHPDALAARKALAHEVHKRDSDLRETLLALQ